MEYCPELPIYTNIWFWMIVIGILFLAIGFVLWTKRDRIPETWWLWVLILAGVILLVIGLFLAFWQGWRSDDEMVDDCYDGFHEDLIETPVLPTRHVIRPPGYPQVETINEMEL